MIDLQDTDKSCHIVLTEFKYHLITKFVLNNSLIAQGNDLPFFIQELGRSYISSLQNRRITGSSAMREASAKREPRKIRL